MKTQLQSAVMIHDAPECKELRFLHVGHLGNKAHHPSFQKAVRFHSWSNVHPEAPLLLLARYSEGKLE